VATTPGAHADRGLPGAVAVVLCAGSPIGQACAARLAAEGAELVVVDPVLTAGGRVPEGAALVASPADDRASLAPVVALCESRWGRIDILVNCHARSDQASVEAATPEVWDRALRDNLLGPLDATVALLDLLKRSGHASVIHIGSVDGLFGNPSVPAYSVAKGGLVPLTHVMAHEFAPYGIRVNCVARAALGSRTDPPDAAIDDLCAVTPLGRPAEPAEIAGAVAHLASTDASYTTGTVLVVDGGRTAVTPGTGRRSVSPNHEHDARVRSVVR
jgi:NAD(P)-dependent dehydrogenase (short-subunit alcohol dehydrogenase family)